MVEQLMDKWFKQITKTNGLIMKDKQLKQLARKLAGKLLKYLANNGKAVNIVCRKTNG